MAIIEYNTLVERDACDEREQFYSMFGDKAEVTVELARKHAHDFDWGWAARNLLPDRLSAQWSRFVESNRNKFRAEVELAEYNLHYTSTGRRRAKPTELQRKQHDKMLEKLRVATHENEAVLFANLYTHRDLKPPKTDTLIKEFEDKIKALVIEIVKANEKESIHDAYQLADIIERQLNQLGYRMSRTVDDVRRELRGDPARQPRRRRMNLSEIDESPF